MLFKYNRLLVKSAPFFPSTGLCTIMQESRSVPPAIVIYLPDEHASLALRIDAAADAVQSFEPAASWQNPVQVGLETSFIEGTLQMPLISFS